MQRQYKRCFFRIPPESNGNTSLLLFSKCLKSRDIHINNPSTKIKTNKQIKEEEYDKEEERVSNSNNI